MDRIRQYEVSRKTHNPNREIYYDVKSTLTFRFHQPSSIDIYFHTVFSEKKQTNTKYNLT